MRTRFLFSLMLIALVGGIACNRSSKPAKQSVFMKRATGFAYEVLVVMDKDIWKGEAGRLLYGQLTASIPGLPQNEPMMRVTYAEPSQFDGLLHYVRNIIHVRVDESLYTKVSVHKEKDRWATGQEDPQPQRRRVGHRKHQIRQCRNRGGGGNGHFADDQRPGTHHTRRSDQSHGRDIPAGDRNLFQQQLHTPEITSYINVRSSLYRQSAK